MLILDRASATLPAGLEFFEVGWWAIHIAAIGFVFMYGFRRGRAVERREQRERAARAAKPPAATPPESR